ncbi:MAG TPA: carboxymuconolactone decarboxylase family protein [Firmicutes bacterium]|nr:carboxymuconolactone decarboxylase family protein [Bacillota bacterium]
MAKSRIKKFKEERADLNKALVRFAGKNMKRLLSIDNRVYEAGALPAATKELLGLVASTVLRCDDCIFYHVDRCHELGISRDELEEALAIAFAVGGTITIPHLRRAVRAWEELQSGSEK